MHLCLTKINLLTRWSSADLRSRKIDKSVTCIFKALVANPLSPRLQKSQNCRNGSFWPCKSCSPGEGGLSHLGIDLTGVELSTTHQSVTFSKHPLSLKIFLSASKPSNVRAKGWGGELDPRGADLDGPEVSKKGRSTRTLGLKTSSSLANLGLWELPGRIPTWSSWSPAEECIPGLKA